VQYVERLNGEPARRSRVSARAAEASWIMRVNGELDGVMRNRFDMGTNPKTQEQDQFRIGDSVRGHATPISKPETEWAGPYKVLYSNSPNERTLEIGRLIRTAASRRY
jgi:hypothetical protein